MRGRTALAVGAAALALAACGDDDGGDGNGGNAGGGTTGGGEPAAKVVDATALEAQLRSRLSQPPQESSFGDLPDSPGVTVSEVTCPEDVALEPGAELRCTVRTREGGSGTATVTVTSATGRNSKYRSRIKTEGDGVTTTNKTSGTLNVTAKAG